MASTAAAGAAAGGEGGAAGEQQGPGPSALYPKSFQWLRHHVKGKPDFWGDGTGEGSSRREAGEKGLKHECTHRDGHTDTPGHVKRQSCFLRKRQHSQTENTSPKRRNYFHPCL